MSFESTFLERTEELKAKIKHIQLLAIQNLPVHDAVNRAALELDGIVASYHVREDKQFKLGQEIISNFDEMREMFDQLISRKEKGE